MEYVQHENPELRVFSIDPGFIETNMAKASGLPMEIFDDSSMFSAELYCGSLLTLYL
jgi:hypothetical protein